MFRFFPLYWAGKATAAVVVTNVSFCPTYLGTYTYLPTFSLSLSLFVSYYYWQFYVEGEGQGYHIRKVKKRAR